ncbi:L,D-transpeptidase family protein [Chitinibacter bivalviorum]|uniref:L,D-transpeptidase family protein n=1 Tax=Chitinibacter bivalviorum TaxID=2739434 RepID=A0A7H9BHL9_9NEIS|nr:L,D-transpeptidase family protein [Chitinibacter bivalviorum]QLG88115.1 L,D-transpeptidase family protein [Chitinibacter bivalviorum]
MLRITRRTKRLICLVTLLLLAPAARPLFVDSGNPYFTLTPEKVGTAAVGTPEERILAALDAIRAGKMADARATVDALLHEHPNYRLAHLLSADLYAMRAMPLDTIGGGADAAFAEKLADLRKEALVRMNYRNMPTPPNLLPANILRFDEQQKFAVLVDAETSRLYLFSNDNGVPKMVKDHYVTVGKLGIGKQYEGDQRTPIGVYFVNNHLSRPALDKTYGALADLYGVGAWPISYPNEWDKSKKKTGHGIWLHGSPAATYSRPPQASNGCVVLTNEEMLDVAQYLDIGRTPVIVTPKVEWLTREQWQTRHEQASQTITQWKTAWESLDNEQYLNFYGNDFVSGEGQNITSWRTQKSAVNASKKWSKIELTELSIFAVTGGEKTQMVATFVQDYRSNNLDNKMRKRQYWHNEAGNWKLSWEGNASN